MQLIPNWGQMKVTDQTTWPPDTIICPIRVTASQNTELTLANHHQTRCTGRHMGLEECVKNIVRIGQQRVLKSKYEYCTFNAAISRIQCHLKAVYLKAASRYSLQMSQRPNHVSVRDHGKICVDPLPKHVVFSPDGSLIWAYGVASRGVWLHFMIYLTPMSVKVWEYHCATILVEVKKKV